MTKFKLTILAFFVFLGTGAQDKPSNEATFESEKVVIDNIADKATYTGNVYCKADRLTITKADSIEYDRKAKKLIAYNVQEVLFDGAVIFSEPTTKPTQMEYALGDTAVYVK